MTAGEPASAEKEILGAPGSNLLASLQPDRCGIWGVLNVTPDSFSDGGLYLAPERAIQRGLEMLGQGADVLDVGGESSRPAGNAYGAGAARVSVEEELRRVVPVVERLVAAGAMVSVDTVKAEVARAVLRAGASVVNDVSCGRSPELLGAVARSAASLVLMHTRGRGEVDIANTAYGDVVREVLGELLEAVERAVAEGVQRDRIWIDPGIGFAKTAKQSAALLGSLRVFVDTGYPVLVGPSRKAFIAELAATVQGAPPAPSERGPGTAAAVAACVLAGARAVRVHDVAEMRQAVLVASAIRGTR